MKKKITCFLLAFAMIFTALPVSATEGYKPDHTSTQVKKSGKSTAYIKLSKKSLKLCVGSSSKLKVSYAKGDSIKKWKSSKTRVATVSKKGVIKAKATGTATITVTLKSGKKSTCKVRVIAKKKKKKTSSNQKYNSGTVYWTLNGSVYHSTPSCPTLSRSKTIKHGSLSSCPKKRACKVCH